MIDICSYIPSKKYVKFGFGSLITDTLHHKLRPLKSFEVISASKSLLQYMKVQSYRHPVYRKEVVLGLFQVLLYRLRPEQKEFSTSGGAVTAFSSCSEEGQGKRNLRHPEQGIG